MNRQINAVSSSCFHMLRLLPKNLRWLPTESRKTVTHALITSRLDYGNAPYAGVTQKQLRKLQDVQNATARLVLDIPCRSHMTTSLTTPLAPNQQENHLQAPHTRIQGSLQRRTRISEPPHSFPHTNQTTQLPPTRTGLRPMDPEPEEDPSPTPLPRPGTPCPSPQAIRDADPIQEGPQDPALRLNLYTQMDQQPPPAP